MLWLFLIPLPMVLSSFVYDIDPAVFSKVFMIAGNLLALGLTCLCYLGVFKCLERKEDIQNQYVLMILTPLLMILVVSEYISHTFYGNVISVEQASDFLIGNHIQMLAVQTLGLISIFAIMYAYQKLSVCFFHKQEAVFIGAAEPLPKAVCRGSPDTLRQHKGTPA